MLNDNLKNIVVLNNLPSNLIDEAIIILKSKNTARRLEPIEKNISINHKKQKENDNDYIIKEAEMVISNYISKMDKNKKYVDNNIEKKYKKIKAYSILVSIVLFFVIIKIII